MPGTDRIRVATISRSPGNAETRRSTRNRRARRASVASSPVFGSRLTTMTVKSKMFHPSLK
jgi:hypothetical protein